MDELEKGAFYDFDKNFKDLPIENRVKLIKTARRLWEVQQVTKENASRTDRPHPVGKEVYDGRH